jgi:hypothetical protein
MPSLLHEGLLELVRERPEFVAELLRDVFGADVPAHDTARVAEGSLNEIVPVEYHSDLLVVLDGGHPVYGVILEAQLQPDERKRFTWPYYGTSGRARFECPFVVLVVTPDRATARWAAEPIDLGAGNVWRPLVLGPDRIPLVVAPERAVKSPELTVLCALAHGGDPAVRGDLALSVLTALAHVDEEQRMIYLALVEPVLGEAIGKAVQMLHPRIEKMVKESWKRMAAPERAEARAEGLAEGRAEGRAEGQAESVLRILERRGLSLSSEERDRILSCRDIAALDVWLDRAVTATTVAELFEPNPK